MKVFTVGHSNHSIETFLDLLRRNGVTAIADVRSHPYSRRFPHFSQAPLRDALRSAGISYVFLGEQLGARPTNRSCYVDDQARYELIATTEEFTNGIERVVKGSERHQIALMCAEQDPIICHRAILVCRHLRNTGLTIQHILKNGEVELHEHLEERLLKLHNLDQISSLLETVNEATPALPVKESEPEESKPEQLLLFDVISFENAPKEHKALSDLLFHEELVQKAYELQSDRIAYREGHSGKDQSHGRAS